MDRKALLKKKVRDLRITRGMSASELVRQMGAGGGFSAANVSRAAEILAKMLADEKCTRFLSFPACFINRNPH